MWNDDELEDLPPVLEPRRATTAETLWTAGAIVVLLLTAGAMLAGAWAGWDAKGLLMLLVMCVCLAVVLGIGVSDWRRLS